MGAILRPLRLSTTKSSKACPCCPVRKNYPDFERIYRAPKTTRHAEDAPTESVGLVEAGAALVILKGRVTGRRLMFGWVSLV
jgi:hypothetical protein